MFHIGFKSTKIGIFDSNVCFEPVTMRGLSLYVKGGATTEVIWAMSPVGA